MGFRQAANRTIELMRLRRLAHPRSTVGVKFEDGAAERRHLRVGSRVVDLGRKPIFQIQIVRVEARDIGCAHRAHGVVEIVMQTSRSRIDHHLARQLLDGEFDRLGKEGWKRSILGDEDCIRYPGRGGHTLHGHCEAGGVIALPDWYQAGKGDVTVADEGHRIPPLSLKAKENTTLARGEIDGGLRPAIKAISFRAWPIGSMRAVI